MIYDLPITICTTPAGFGAPFQGRLTVKAAYLCAEQTVFHRRSWESVQAGTRVDRMVQIPLRSDGLPVTNLSLRRMEDNYDLCRPAP